MNEDLRASDTSLVVTLTSYVEGEIVRRVITFSAVTFNSDAPMLLAIEQAINESTCLRAHIS